MRVRVDNGLPEDTSVHWHGLPIVNGMDGVPGVTQKPIKPGEEFVYEFAVPVSGTYMYHSHPVDPAIRCRRPREPSAPLLPHRTPSLSPACLSPER